MLLDTNVVLDVLLHRAEWLAEAFTQNGTDFEDEVQMASARAHGLDAIVTRDEGGFSGSAVKVMSPKDLIERWAR